MQIKRVEVGSLTYTVVEGEAKVTKAKRTESILEEAKRLLS
jgi:hypothetical protein